MTPLRSTSMRGQLKDATAAYDIGAGRDAANLDWVPADRGNGVAPQNSIALTLQRADAGRRAPSLSDFDFLVGE